LSDYPGPKNLDVLAARLGTEWARKVRETFRSLHSVVPPAWPGTRAGARSLVDRLSDETLSPLDVERLTTIIEERAELAWRKIRRFAGESLPAEAPDEPVKRGSGA
jgi:hypothetical protein